MTEPVWSQVQAARALLSCESNFREAQAQRVSLALVLADAAADGEDTGALTAEYARARADHAYAAAALDQARDELRAARGVA